MYIFASEFKSFAFTKSILSPLNQLLSGELKPCGIENITLGAAAVGYRTESMHGAGSPQAQRIMIARQGNLAAKKKIAKQIAKIKE